MAILTLKNVSSSPWGAPLLKNIDLELQGGEVHGLIGPNGAGKTSLLRCISGDLPVDSGTIQFGGRDLQDWPLRERARSMAVLPQLSLLNFPYTVEEVVMLGRTPHETGARLDREVVDAALEEMDIQSMRKRLYTQLSGGEKQRVQLARIFAQLWLPQGTQPRLLLLDEPTAALDLAHQLQLLDLIRRIAREGCSVVLVVHDFNLLSGVAARLSALRSGELLAQGPVESVMAADVFDQLFGVKVHITSHPADGRPIVISS